MNLVQVENGKIIECSTIKERDTKRDCSYEPDQPGWIVSRTFFLTMHKRSFEWTLCCCWNHQTKPIQLWSFILVVYQNVLSLFNEWSRLTGPARFHIWTAPKWLSLFGKRPITPINNSIDYKTVKIKILIFYDYCSLYIFLQ